jgi:hypothetical protein
VAKPWNFGNCEAYNEWCHISRGFPHSRYKLHCNVDKANLYHCKWFVFKEQCIEMCQHVYETFVLEHNECPRSILRMVYAEVVLGKQVDWTTINIQSKSNMKAPLHLYVGSRRKFPYRGLGKKISSNEVPNLLVVWSAT